MTPAAHSDRPGAHHSLITNHTPDALLADDLQSQATGRPEANDPEVIVIRPRSLPTRAFQNREGLTVCQRKLLVVPLAAQGPGAFEVAILHVLTPHSALE